MSSSPSDSGRDIVAQLLRKDIGGQQYFETWFVDCKHYQKGVPPEKVNSLLAWSWAERADVALIVASNQFSNPCKNFLKLYETENRPPYRIRYWERSTLLNLISGKEESVRSYLRPNMRTEAEVVAAENEFHDRFAYEYWYAALDDQQFGSMGITNQAEVRKTLEDRYGKDSLVMRSDQESGMLLGKLSALRWMLGDDWDNLPG